MEPVRHRFEVVPGELYVDVFQHAVDSSKGPVACWSYVTDGLHASGQKEILLTVSRDRREVVPSEEPLQLFAKVRERAAAGTVTDIGHFAGFRSMSNFGGVIFGALQPLSGIPAPPDALAAILITQDELEVATRCGVSRIIARLGDAYRYFPFPPWSDPSRGSVVSPEFWQRSILSKLLTLRIPGTTVRKEADEVLLRLPAEAAKVVDETLSKLAAETPVAFLTDPDPEADAMLVWQPGQREPRAITPPGSNAEHMSGCFIGFLPLGFLPQHEQKNVSELYEDGFMLKLTSQSWKEVAAALRSGKPLSIPGVSGSRLLGLAWRSAVVPVEIDDETGFKITSIVLYQPEVVVQDRVAHVEALATFINEIKTICGHFFAGATTPETVDLVIAIRPGRRFKVWFVSMRGPQDSQLDGLRRRLESAEPPEVRNGLVICGILGAIAKAKRPIPSTQTFEPPIPTEWKQATGRVPAGKLLEDLVELVWSESDQQKN